jgi:hypothetical protein
MTLWESAPRQKCVNCGKQYRVWNPSEAWKKGESTLTFDYPDWEPYIDSGWVSHQSYKVYEGWCTECRKEDLILRIQLMTAECNEAKSRRV